MTTQYSSSQYYTTASAVPITGKDQAFPQYDGGYGGHGSYSVSPPESDTASTASGGAMYSSGSAYSSTGYSAGGYSTGGYPSAAASYAGSSHGGDYETASAAAYSTSGLDFVDYVQDRLDEFRNPTRLDTCMVKQAQASGSLNAKERQLLERTKKAKARLARARTTFSDGVALARDVHRDLQWTHDSVLRSQAMVASKHSREYRQGRERYPEAEY